MDNRMIILTESQYKQLIKENRESKNQRIARNLMRERGYSDGQTKEIYNAIRNDIPNSRVCQYSYFPMVTRMYLDSQLNDVEIIHDLNKVLFVIGTGKLSKNLEPTALFNATPEQFIETYKDDVISFNSNIKNRVNSNMYQENKNYTIVPINNEAEASKYGKYTTWCITHPEQYDNMYDNYTNGGVGRFYFCLQNGFENIERKEGKNCPLDEYGLSMIAVSVDANGECNTVTCRWNHDNNGNDNIMDEEQLSNIIGRNFYQTFLPYTDEEQIAKGNITPNIALKMIAQGKDPNDIFDVYVDLGNGSACVKLNNKNNFLRNGQYTLDFWAMQILNLSINGAKIFEVDKDTEDIGLANSEGFLITKKWYHDYVSIKNNDIAVTKDDDGNEIYLNLNTGNETTINDYIYSLISKNINVKFNDVIYLKNGNHIVKYLGKYNILIGESGKFFFNEWFEYAHSLDGSELYNIYAFNIGSQSKCVLVNIDNFKTMSVFNVRNFSNGVAKVIRNAKESFLIDKNMDVIDKQIYTHIGILQEGGIAFAEDKNGVECIINNKGHRITKEAYKSCSKFDSHGLATITYNNNEESIIDNNGNNLGDINTVVNNLLKSGRPLKEIFTRVDRPISNPSIKRVHFASKMNLIDENNHLLYNKWFDKIGYPRSYGLARVTENDKINFINLDSQLLLPNQWLEYADCFNEDYEGYCYVETKNETPWYMDTNGKLYPYHEFITSKKNEPLDNNTILNNMETNRDNNLFETKIINESQGVNDDLMEVAKLISKQIATEDIPEILNNDYYLSDWMEGYDDTILHNSIIYNNNVYNYKIYYDSNANKKGESDGRTISLNYAFIEKSLMGDTKLSQYDYDEDFDIDKYIEEQQDTYFPYQVYEDILEVVLHELTHTLNKESNTDYIWTRGKMPNYEEEDAKYLLYFFSKDELNARIASAGMIMNKYLQLQSSRNDKDTYKENYNESFKEIINKIFTNQELGIDEIMYYIKEIKQNTYPDYDIEQYNKYNKIPMNYALFLALNDDKLYKNSNFNYVKKIYIKDPQLFINKVYDTYISKLNNYKNKIYRTCWYVYENYDWNLKNEEEF